MSDAFDAASHGCFATAAEGEEQDVDLALSAHHQATLDAAWARFRSNAAEQDGPPAARLPAILPRLGDLTRAGARIDEEPRSWRR